MNVLLDTDILIDVALNRLPFATDASAILDSAENHLFNSFIAWHSISNFYYIVTSVKKNTDTKNFITDLLKFVMVAPSSTKDVLYALTLEVPDFEDALQIAAASSCKAEKIVTRNLKHYKKSPIPVQSPKQFRDRL